MLEQTRRQASVFIYLIFGLLIVIFILGINPGNRSGSEGCSLSSNTVVTVDGNDAKESSFRVAYSAPQLLGLVNNANGRQRVYLALDHVIRRELLAQAAADHGIRADDDLAIEAVKRGDFFLGGQRLDLKRQFFQYSDDNTESHFSNKLFKGWVNSLNISESSYLDEQARGVQAAMMAELLSSSVRVSRDEALANYLYENNTVTYDMVVFEPAKYRRDVQPTDADIKRYIDAHTAEVQARYKAEERTYKGIKPQLALREIFIPKALPEAAKPDDKAAKPDDKAAKPDDKAAKPDDKAKPADKTAKADDKAKPADKAAKADDKAKPADKKPAAGDAYKPFGLPIDVAKAKLEAVRTAVAAGKLTFVDAEKQLAADSAEDQPAENGDRGWRSVDGAELGEKALNDAVKTLKPGEMTPVIVTDRGAYLVIATDKREGDLSFDQVKSEIARDLAKDPWSKEAAKRAALDTLARARSTGQSLEQMFEREVVKPGGFDEIINNPNLTPEQKQQILQQLMQQQKHGALEVHEKDVPVAWYADADGSAQTASPPAAGSAAPSAGGAAPAAGAAPAPATGSAAPGSAAGGASPAGSAAPGGATPAGSAANAGSGAGSGSAATPAPPPPPAEIVASSEVLPKFGDIAKPKVSRQGPVPRQDKLPGVAGSKSAIDSLFDELSAGDLAKKIYEGEDGSYVVIQLINRAQPKVEDFEKTADVEIARMQAARGKAAVHDWLKSRCETLTKAGKIRAAADRIRESDDKGNPAPTVYHPCMYLDYLDR